MDIDAFERKLKGNKVTRGEADSSDEEKSPSKGKSSKPKKAEMKIPKETTPTMTFNELRALQNQAA
jgi:hypothetical protein